MSPLQFYCRFTEWLLSWIPTTSRHSNNRLPFSNIFFVNLCCIITWVLFISLILYKPLFATEWSRNIQWSRSLWATLVITGSVCITCHWLFSWMFWNQRARKLNQGSKTESIYKSAPRWMCWIMAFIYLPTMSILTPVIGILGLQNIYGAYRWHQVKTDLTQKGEILNWQDWITTNASPDEDFGSLPIFEEAKHEANLKHGRKVSPSFNLPESSLLQKLNLPYAHLPEGRRNTSTLPNASIDHWALAFKTAISNQTKRATDNTSNHKSELPNYPRTAEGASSLEVIAKAMTVADELLREVHEASYRPHLVLFTSDYQISFESPMPHFGVIKSMVSYLKFRTMVYLEQKKPELAQQDILCIFRISELLKNDPLLITHLVRVAIANAAVDSVLAGIANHQWGEGHLLALEKSMDKIEFTHSHLDALRGERAASLGMFESLTNNQIPSPVMPSIGPLLGSGWIRLNQSAHAVTLQAWFESIAKVLNQPDGYQGLEFIKAVDPTSIKNSHTFNPHYILVKQLMPAFENSFNKSLRAQHFVHTAITACTLERYYLRHKSYPPALKDLVPEFIPQVPLDIMDRSELKYERTQGGMFRLWSIGLDGEDDGGDSEKDRDWVWPRESSWQ